MRAFVSKVSAALQYGVWPAIRSKVVRAARHVKDERHFRRFQRHNREVWNTGCRVETDGEILLECFTFASSVISQSYMTNLLARRFHARAVGYFVGKRPEDRIQRLYQSFNVEHMFNVVLSAEQRQKRDRMFEAVRPSIRTKRDVENLTIDGVWIGDLLYDSHMRNYEVPTVDLADTRFWQSLSAALGHLVFWSDYFKRHVVRAVVVSHCVYYESATIVRVALAHGVPAYQVNATHVYRMTSERPLAYVDFFDYPEEFRQLSDGDRHDGMAVAKERLERRFAGEVGVDMLYSTKSAYATVLPYRVIRESSKPKLLIATHCFFDSPHPYGINLFPDFYEWLTYLGGISEETDYDWYIKTHPDFLPGNKPIIEEFCRRYPRFTLVPAEVSHKQLIQEGLDCALSVYGTIGFEYAGLGSTVIFASLCNPCIAYDFNIHPRSVEEYREVLLSLPTRKWPAVDREKVLEYYFMRFIYNNDNWLFPDYIAFVKAMGGYTRQGDAKAYSYFVEGLSCERHASILRSLGNFIDSGDYCFRPRHLDRGGGRAT